MGDVLPFTKSLFTSLSTLFFASPTLHQSFCFYWLLILLLLLQSLNYHFRLEQKPPPIILSHRASFLVKIGLNTLFVLCNLIPLPPRMLLWGLFSFFSSLAKLHRSQKKEEQQHGKISLTTLASLFFLFNFLLVLGHNFTQFLHLKLCSNKILFFCFYLSPSDTSRTKCFGSVLVKVRLENE